MLRVAPRYVTTQAPRLRRVIRLLNAPHYMVGADRMKLKTWENFERQPAKACRVFSQGAPWSKLCDYVIDLHAYLK